MCQKKQANVITLALGGVPVTVHYDTDEGWLAVKVNDATATELRTQPPESGKSDLLLSGWDGPGEPKFRLEIPAKVPAK